VEIRMHAHEIALCQQRVEIDLTGVELLLSFLAAIDVVVEHVHPPPAAATLRQREADAAHADDPERLADEILSDVAEWFPRSPLPCEGVVVAFDDASGGGN